MLIETRKRSSNDPLSLAHHDLLIIAVTEADSELLDLMGQPGSTFEGEVRLADGYGEHCLLIRPLLKVLPDGCAQVFPREEKGSGEKKPQVSCPRPR
jgi:hypothetical protein